MAGNNQRTIIIYISLPLLAHRADGAMSKKRMVRREGLGGLLRLQAINDLPVLECVGPGRRSVLRTPENANIAMLDTV